MVKTCPKCDRRLPLAEFHREPEGRDGRRNQCRDCRGRYQAERYERLKADPLWLARHRRRASEWYYQRVKTDPELLARRRASAVRSSKKKKVPTRTRRARKALEQAVYDGRITKPEACEACGLAVEARLLDGHHTDYARPLDVVWLCRRCHTAAHGRLRPTEVG